MAVEDLGKFQLKRVNPFQGLVIDADAWRDAHNYHRDHLRLHLLAFHRVGIMEGLGVRASSPPDLSVTVEPGIGVDPEGEVIIVAQRQRYKLQTSKSGPVYLVIQYREVPGEPYQPPNGGQPTRLLDAYRIQEREKPPPEAYLELARIDFDPARSVIADAKSPQRPGKNEIDLRYRVMATAPPPPERISTPPPRIETTPAVARPQTVLMGHAVLAGDKDLHLEGLQNVARRMSAQVGMQVSVQASMPLDQSLKACALLYLTGKGKFEADSGQQTALAAFLQSGGAIVGEGCSDGDESASRGAKEFGLAFNQLAGQLKRRLEVVKRGHPLLSALHLFSAIPQGAENGMLMEGGDIVYSGSDYGCAWQGGRQNQPLSREIIRASFEMGDNFLAYARLGKGGG
jgi:hypothetical protein